MPYTNTGVGYQNTDTSIQAAILIEPKTKTLRAHVLNLVRECGAPIDAETIAQRLGKPYASIQPRISELRNDGFLIDSGLRAIGQYGKQIIRWTAARKDAEA